MEYLESLDKPESENVSDNDRPVVLNALNPNDSVFIDSSHKLSTNNNELFHDPPTLSFNDTSNNFELVEANIKLSSDTSSNIVSNSSDSNSIQKKSLPKSPLMAEDIDLNQDPSEFNRSSTVRHSVAFKTEEVINLARELDLNPSTSSNFISKDSSRKNTRFSASNTPILDRHIRENSSLLPPLTSTSGGASSKSALKYRPPPLEVDWAIDGDEDTEDGNLTKINHIKMSEVMIIKVSDDEYNNDSNLDDYYPSLNPHQQSRTSIMSSPDLFASTAQSLLLIAGEGDLNDSDIQSVVDHQSNPVGMSERMSRCSFYTHDNNNNVFGGDCFDDHDASINDDLSNSMNNRRPFHHVLTPMGPLSFITPIMISAGFSHSERDENFSMNNDFNNLNNNNVISIDSAMRNKNQNAGVTSLTVKNKNRTQYHPTSDNLIDVLEDESQDDTDDGTAILLKETLQPLNTEYKRNKLNVNRSEAIVTNSAISSLGLTPVTDRTLSDEDLASLHINNKIRSTQNDMKLLLLESDGTNVNSSQWLLSDSSPNANETIGSNFPVTKKSFNSESQPEIFKGFKPRVADEKDDWIDSDVIENNLNKKSYSRKLEVPFNPSPNSDRQLNLNSPAASLNVKNSKKLKSPNLSSSLHPSSSHVDLLNPVSPLLMLGANASIVFPSSYSHSIPSDSLLVENNTSSKPTIHFENSPFTPQSNFHISPLITLNANDESNIPQPQKLKPFASPRSNFLANPLRTSPAPPSAKVVVVHTKNSPSVHQQPFVINGHFRTRTNAHSEDRIQMLRQEVEELQNENDMLKATKANSDKESAELIYKLRNELFELKEKYDTVMHEVNMRRQAGNSSKKNINNDDYVEGAARSGSILRQKKRFVSTPRGRLSLASVEASNKNNNNNGNSSFNDNDNLVNESLSEVKLVSGIKSTKDDNAFEEHLNDKITNVSERDSINGDDNVRSLNSSRRLQKVWRSSTRRTNRRYQLRDLTDDQTSVSSVAIKRVNSTNCVRSSFGSEAYKEPASSNSENDSRENHLTNYLSSQTHHHAQNFPSAENEHKIFKLQNSSEKHLINSSSVEILTNSQSPAAFLPSGIEDHFVSKSNLLNAVSMLEAELKEVKHLFNLEKSISNDLKSEVERLSLQLMLSCNQSPSNVQILNHEEDRFSSPRNASILLNPISLRDNFDQGVAENTGIGSSLISIHQSIPSTSRVLKRTFTTLGDDLQVTPTLKKKAFNVEGFKSIDFAHAKHEKNDLVLQIYKGNNTNSKLLSKLSEEKQDDDSFLPLKQSSLSSSPCSTSSTSSHPLSSSTTSDNVVGRLFRLASMYSSPSRRDLAINQHQQNSHPRPAPDEGQNDDEDTDIFKNQKFTARNFIQLEIKNNFHNERSPSQNQNFPFSHEDKSPKESDESCVVNSIPPPILFVDDEKTQENSKDEIDQQTLGLRVRDSNSVTSLEDRLKELSREDDKRVVNMINQTHKLDLEENMQRISMILKASRSNESKTHRTSNERKSSTANINYISNHIFDRPIINLEADSNSAYTAASSDFHEFSPSRLINKNKFNWSTDEENELDLKREGPVPSPSSLWLLPAKDTNHQSPLVLTATISHGELSFRGSMLESALFMGNQRELNTATSIGNDQVNVENQNLLQSHLNDERDEKLEESSYTEFGNRLSHLLSNKISSVLQKSLSGRICRLSEVGNEIRCLEESDTSVATGLNKNKFIFQQVRERRDNSEPLPIISPKSSHHNLVEESNNICGIINANNNNGDNDNNNVINQSEDYHHFRESVATSFRSQDARIASQQVIYENDLKRPSIMVEKEKKGVEAQDEHNQLQFSCDNTMRKTQNSAELNAEVNSGLNIRSQNGLKPGSLLKSRFPVLQALLDDKNDSLKDFCHPFFGDDATDASPKSNKNKNSYVNTFLSTHPLGIDAGASSAKTSRSGNPVISNRSTSQINSLFGLFGIRIQQAKRQRNEESRELESLIGQLKCYLANIETSDEGKEMDQDVSSAQLLNLNEELNHHSLSILVKRKQKSNVSKVKEVASGNNKDNTKKIVSSPILSNASPKSSSPKLSHSKSSEGEKQLNEILSNLTKTETSKNHHSTTYLKRSPNKRFIDDSTSKSVPAAKRVPSATPDRAYTQFPVNAEDSSSKIISNRKASTVLQTRDSQLSNPSRPPGIKSTWVPDLKSKKVLKKESLKNSSSGFVKDGKNQVRSNSRLIHTSPQK